MGQYEVRALFATTLLIACFVSFSMVQSVDPKLSVTFTVPCKIDTYGDVWDGILAYGLLSTNPTNINQFGRSYLVVMDTNGQLIHLRESSDTSYWDVKYMGNDTLMFQGEPGWWQATHFWNFTTNVTTDFSQVSGHHEVIYNPSTHTFLTLSYYLREINGKKILFDKIVELSETGSLLWSWDTYDHIPLSTACPFNETWPLGIETGNITASVLDFTHANALQWDFDENIIYLNVRHINTFYKIDKTTGKLIWACGEHGNFTLLDGPNGKKVSKPSVFGGSVSSLWYHSHGTKEVEPNVFIMFDNDFHNQTNPDNAHSRMIEVTLNEQSMTAWISWSWTAPKEYWSEYWGKADRLPNGDRIGVFGTQRKIYANDTGAVLVEVNSKGKVVRTYTFPRGWGIYRIEEIPVQTNPPIISVISPENKTYTVTDVPLTLTVSKSSSRIGYSLDGQANVTITGNTTLTGLSDGTHSLKTYAKATFGNTESFDTVYFTIDTNLPSLSILSPMNKTYDTTTIPLNFTVTEPASWISYSLDSQENITIAGNTTLTGLSEGSHSLIIYAKDTAGNTGTSETIYFTAAQPSEPFPITWILAAIATIATGVAITLGVAMYRIKRSTSTKIPQASPQLQ